MQKIKRRECSASKLSQFMSQKCQECNVFCVTFKKNLFLKLQSWKITEINAQKHLTAVRQDRLGNIISFLESIRASVAEIWDLIQVHVSCYPPDKIETMVDSKSYSSAQSQFSFPLVSLIIYCTHVVVFTVLVVHHNYMFKVLQSSKHKSSISSGV